MNMIARFTDYCIRKEIISEGDAEWFSYGLVHRCGNLFVICILFPIGCWLSTIRTALAFFMSFFLLRKRTNGYHAKTMSGCFLFSLCSEFALFLLILPHLCNTTVLMICAVSVIVILLLAPYNHPNLHMTEDEMTASGHMARKTVLILFLLTILTWRLGYYHLANGFSLGIVYTALLLIIADILNGKTERGNNEQ